MDAAALGVFWEENTTQDPDRAGDDFRIRMSHELYKLYDDIDVVWRITKLYNVCAGSDMSYVWTKKLKWSRCLRRELMLGDEGDGRGLDEWTKWRWNWLRLV